MRVITRHEEFRREKGLSGTGYSERMRVSRALVSMVEGRRVRASEEYRRRAARILGVRASLLFDADGWAL